MVRYDIALENNDLIFANGDLVIGESDYQHIADTLNSFPGWWKEYPLDGVGLFNWNKSPAYLQEINRKVYLELESDGYKVKAPLIKLTPAGDLLINPNAELL